MKDQCRKTMEKQDIFTKQGLGEQLDTLTKQELRKLLGEWLLSGEGELTACLESEKLKYFIGDECARDLTKREINLLLQLDANIGKVRKELIYREALFFTCFEKKHIHKVLEFLEYDEEEKSIYSTVNDELEEIAFIANKLELKKFIYQNGYEYYEFLHALSKQQRKAFDLHEYRILSRIALLEEIQLYKEVVFEEDLAITAQELIDSGIVEAHEGEKMLGMLVDVTHKVPRMNTKEKLLKQARLFKKFPLVASFRKVKWIK